MRGAGVTGLGEDRVRNWACSCGSTASARNDSSVNSVVQKPLNHPGQRGGVSNDGLQGPSLSGIETSFRRVRFGQFSRRYGQLSSDLDLARPEVRR